MTVPRFTKGTLIIAVFLVCSMLGCGEQKAPKEVKQPKKAEKQLTQAPKEKPLKICVGSAITPKEGYIYYRQLIDYIGEKMERKASHVDKATYKEINDGLRNGQIDVAFVCGKPYVDAHDEFGLELLVVPEMYGATTYYSYIIVPKDSPAKSLADLRGKTFAFSDPESNSGKLVPTYLLSLKGETPDSFFKKHIYSYAHDKSIRLVNNNMVDGAAVDSLIWEYLNSFDSEHTVNTKVIEKSPPCGIPPVVVPSGINIKTKERLRQVFLNMHLDTKGQNILKNMAIDRFVSVTDSHYDFIRQMKAKVAAQADK